MDSTRERDREDHRDSGKDRDHKDVDEDHHHHHRSSTDKHRSKLEKHRERCHEPRAAAHDRDERVREESVERRRHSSERGGGDSEDRVSDEEKKERRGKRRFEDGCEDTTESRDHANTAGSKVEKKTTTPLGPAGSLNPPPPPQSGLASIHDGIEAVSDNDAAGSQYKVSEQSRLAKERQEKAKQEFLTKRRAAALAVPTNDMAVRALLRRLGQSITLFGEREMERRHRLRTLMAKLDNEDLERLIMKAHEDEKAAASATNDDDEEDNVQSYPFYTEGSLRLRQARLEITEYAFKRADSRLKRARSRRDADEIDLALNQAAKGLTLKYCSGIDGDDRPLSGCSFSHDGTILATCYLSGVAKLWSMPPPQVTKISTLRGHTARATDVTFSPTDNNYVATASADRTARIWNSEGDFLRTFEGHLDRLARIAFHPSGKYLGTTSFDKTWRLWDVETGEELLLQEGHSRAVYGISFHPDGSLVATCGLDALTRVWDLRTGMGILALEGHVKPVLGVSFSPNGYHLASGGADNTCRIWDLRKKKSVYVIPAHTNLVSQVKFEPREGYSLVTASYDMTAKVWSSRDFKLVKTLSDHEAKVTSLDVTGHGQCVATVAHDRTIKLWSS